jgi:hypothetical protein
LDGVSALVSVNGAITHEQWFSRAPDPHEWQNFQRSIALPESARQSGSLTVSDALPWRREAIGRSGETLATTGSAREWMWVAIVAWLLMLPTLWLANDWRNTWQGKRDAATRLAETEQSLNATIVSREAALGAIARTEKLASLYQQPDNLLVLAEANEVLGTIAKANTIQLTEWDLRAGQLRFVLTPPAGASASTMPPGTTIIKAFEKLPTWRDIQANVEGARTVVSARIERNTSAVTAPATSTANNATSGGAR